MRVVFKLLLQILVFSFVVTSVAAVTPQEGVFSLIIGGLLFAFVMYLVNPILDFFRFPRNFWGYLVIGTLFSVLFFVILDSLVFGILTFGIGNIGGGFGPISLPVISLSTKFLTVLFTAIYAALLSIILEFLSETK